MSEPLYHSPIGLYPFQQKGIARWILHGRRMPVWDTGTGKSHIALATSAILFEDEKICLALVVCEQAKIGEFRDDFGTFTRLDYTTYYGDKARRERIRNQHPPRVLISSYETIRNDASHLVKRKVGRRTQSHREDGPFTEMLCEMIRATGKGVCIAYDEVTKLANRTSENYKSHHHMIKRIAAAAESVGAKVWVAGMTATPIERDPENVFNEWRLIDPEHAPTVEEFERDYVQYRDFHGNPTFKNIGREREHRDPWVTILKERMSYILDVKSKFDDDIRDQFPKMVEEYAYVEMSPHQGVFYSEVEKFINEEAEARDFDERALYTVLRQISCHPLSLTLSKGGLAKRIVAEVGTAGLAKIGAPKLDRLLLRFEALIKGQGAKAVVFTFFGDSVLPLIGDALESHGYVVARHSGKMSRDAKEEAKARFRHGDAQIFLSSDAGSRGLNLPEALYIENYEMALTHATNVQRANRAHRIDSTNESITVNSLILKGTIEEGVVRLNQTRNEWHDALLDVDNNDDGFDRLTAADRRLLMTIARSKAA